MLEIEKFKIFNVEMHYDNSTTTNIVSEEIINSYSLTESPFILNKLADKIHDKSYRALSPAEKILVLSWLCDTLLNSSRVRDQMSEERKSSQVSFVNRKETAGNRVTKKRRKKRTRISDNAEEEDIKVRKKIVTKVKRKRGRPPLRAHLKTHT